jgi:hypothetical protein
MASIVAVHGIAQQQLGRNQMVDFWSRALADGLERASGTRATLPELDIAYYGDLFLAPTGGAKGSDTDESLIRDLSPGELADIRDSLEEAGLAIGDDGETKGFGRMPIAVQRVLRAVDRRFGSRAGVLLVGELRQVLRYLTDDVLKEAVHERITEAVSDDTRVLIGHSLGSVVVAEHLRRDRGREWDLVVTLGSPLPLRLIRDQLRPGTLDGVPSSVRRWVNVRDERDPVACGGALGTWNSRAEDTVVDNGSDAHSVTRYLGKKETGMPVLEALDRED